MRFTLFPPSIIQNFRVPGLIKDEKGGVIRRQIFFYALICLLLIQNTESSPLYPSHIPLALWIQTSYKFAVIIKINIVANQPCDPPYPALPPNDLFSNSGFKSPKDVSMRAAWLLCWDKDHWSSSMDQQTSWSQPAVTSRESTTLWLPEFMQQRKAELKANILGKRQQKNDRFSSDPTRRSLQPGWTTFSIQALFLNAIMQSLLAYPFDLS